MSPEHKVFLREIYKGLGSSKVVIHAIFRGFKRILKSILNQASSIHLHFGELNDFLTLEQLQELKTLINASKVSRN
jgi:hypothetical protein